jgi:hypothetical protein
MDTEFDFDELGTSLIFDLVDLQFDIRELEASDCTTEESSGSWYICSAGVHYEHLSDFFTVGSVSSHQTSNRKRKLTPVSAIRSKAQRLGKTQAARSVLRKKHILDIEQILEQQTRRPNCTRQQPRLLQAFPNFDKCDSLLFFAHAWARHMNSGDYDSMYKLMSRHVDKSYQITMNHCPALHNGFNCRSFVKLFELMDGLQPDRIMCVHATKVLENQIHSTMYMKFTDVKVLYESIVPNIRDPNFKAMWGGMKRSDGLKRKLLHDERPAEEVTRLLALADTDQDLTVNVRLELTLTIDQFSKKVQQLQWSGRLMSMYPTETVR